MRETNKKEFKKICLNIGCGLNPVPTTDTELWINIDKIDLKDFFKSEKKYKDQKIIFEQMDLDMEQQIISEFYGSSGFFKRYGKFDFVLMNDIFEHLKDPLKVMYDVWLSCKKDALINISCPYQGSHAAWSDIGHIREINETMLGSLADDFYEFNKEANTCFSPYKLLYPFSFEKVDNNVECYQGNMNRVSIVLKVKKEVKK